METKSKQTPVGSSFRVPPFMPTKTGIWFSILEKYFGVAGIIHNDEKALALMGFLEPQYLAKIEDAVTNLPATGQYDKLKSKLIRALTESDSAKVERLVEREEMGDRKPSQFYNDLKKLASPFASDEFILNLWRNRLPDRIREVLAAVDDTSIEKLTRTADKIDEAYNRIGQRAHKVGTIAEPPAPHVDKNDALAAEVSRLREEIKALKIGGYRRPRRRSNSLTRPGAVPVRETTRVRTEFAFIMRDSAIAPRNAPSRVSGSRETTPAIRKSGGRRRLGISPHLYRGLENENFVLSGHRGRHQRLSPKQAIQGREENSVRIIRCQ